MSPETDVNCKICEGLGLLIVTVFICGIPIGLYKQNYLSGKAGDKFYATD